MTSLTGAIYSFPHATYIVTRTPAGYYDKGRLVQFEIDEQIIADSSSDSFTLVDHEMVTGTGPVQLKALDTTGPDVTGVLPVGLAARTNYWVIAIDDNHFRLATSRAAALEGNYVLMMDDGAGELRIESPFTFPIVAGVQSAGGAAVLDDPEASSVDEILVVYTETMLTPRTDGTSTAIPYDSDSIEIDFWGMGPENWYVYKVEKYTAHYRAYVARGSSVHPPAARHAATAAR